MRNARKCAGQFGQKSKIQNKKQKDGKQTKNKSACKIDKKCGGCQFQKMPYKEQLKRKQKQEEQARHDNRQEAARAVFNSEGLTAELTDLLIDRVLVYPDNRIEIAYKIKDIFD